MAGRVQSLAQIVTDTYGGRAERLWTEASSGADLLARVMALPGFGKQKAQIFTALLAKRLDVRPEGWEQAVGDYAEDGYRSVADVTDPSRCRRCATSRRPRRRPRVRRDRCPGARPRCGCRDQVRGRMTNAALDDSGSCRAPKSFDREVFVSSNARKTVPAGVLAHPAITTLIAQAATLRKRDPRGRPSCHRGRRRRGA